MLLSEKIVNTEEFAGTVDIITGIDNFESTCIYNPEWHTYRLNGKIIPSVTRLLDDGSYLNVDPKILESAQMRGTLIHEEIEDYLKYEEMGYTDETMEFIEYFINNKEKFEKQAVWDIKTYSTATPKNRKKCYEQLKMYADAIEYLTGIKIKNKYMIHLPYKKKMKVYDLEEEFNEERNLDSSN